MGPFNSVSPAERKITEHSRAGRALPTYPSYPKVGLSALFLHPCKAATGRLSRAKGDLTNTHINHSAIQTGSPRYLHF